MFMVQCHQMCFQLLSIPEKPPTLEFYWTLKNIGA